MVRRPESEIMGDHVHAQAYADADFGDVNDEFVHRVVSRFPQQAAGSVLDLGCGPADIPIRLARSSPKCEIVAVDASQAMLDLASQAIQQEGLASRISLILAQLPDLDISEAFDLIMSNSLVHHLPHPHGFWATLKQWAGQGTALMVTDLIRPPTQQVAEDLVERYAGGQSPTVRSDFRNSLLAAFTIEEVRNQLEESGLSHLRLGQVSDRHWMVEGVLLQV